MLSYRYVAVPLLCFPVIIAAQSSGSEDFFTIDNAGSDAQPYTATFETKHVQTLADGTTITSTRISKEGRDSEGRTFHQSTLPGQDQVTNTVVFRVPEHEILSWMSQSNTATVQHMRTPEPGSRAQLKANAAAKPPQEHA